MNFLNYIPETGIQDNFVPLIAFKSFLFFKDAYGTVDFASGADVTDAFEQQRKVEPKGPLVNSEFYPGWFTHWGEKMANVDSSRIIKTLREMLDVGANVNFYMFYGGTNFGFTAGASFASNYQAQIQSYDYDAPISEAGDLTDKYYELREVLAEYVTLPNITVETAPKGLIYLFLSVFTG